MTKEQEGRFNNSIVQLSGDPRFAEFIQVVGEQKDRALAEAVANSAIANPHVSAAYLGEVRAYMDIIAIYNEAISRRAIQTSTDT